MKGKYLTNDALRFVYLTSKLGDEIILYNKGLDNIETTIDSQRVEQINKLFITKEIPYSSIVDRFITPYEFYDIGRKNMSKELGFTSSAQVPTGTLLAHQQLSVPCPRTTSPGNKTTWQ